MSTIKPRTKTIIILIIGMILGAFIAYGFMWWQVYQKFNTVWTCQVFVGQLSIEESEHCARFKADKADGGVKYY